MLSFMAIPSVAWILLSDLILPYQVKGEDLQKEDLPPKTSCPKGSLAYGSHCYGLFLSPKSWSDAYFACHKRPQGHLVSVLTASEAYFVASMIRKTGMKNEDVWMGLHDPTEGHKPNGSGWEWSSNDILNYLAWEESTPCYPNTGYCGTLSATSNYEQWRGYDCNKELPYVWKDLQKEKLSPRISCPQGSVAYGSRCYALFLSPKS
ncbi:lithostathine-like [Sorex fumeus]|uniref:lithostathine-like n=1 Tax=Sorex fumeus TaxID=62283 RepID=UPI0024AD0C44|nr:lithostathine-like [Sorex fumeus]